ncbi:MAG: rRNA maturation RNase YbeY, partial [Candidatus Gracilibacteria bacterium]|nr:rRNA maturation RNase YbeY [Candidatus Gracilibacteria bacterium]
MFKYNILNNPSFEIDENIVENIFKEIKNNILISQQGILNIIFVSGEEIKILNKDYRKKDYVTDVLSFHYYEDFSKIEKSDIAGELIFCEEKIISQAKEYGLGNQLEFY